MIYTFIFHTTNKSLTEPLFCRFFSSYCAIFTIHFCFIFKKQKKSSFTNFFSALFKIDKTPFVNYNEEKTAPRSGHIMTEGLYHAMKQKTSMQEIADRLNLSKNAVSLALNNKPGVSEETRQLVLSLAKKLNYSLPSQKNQSLSNNILLFIPEYIRDDHYFYNEIYWSIDYNATHMGYNLVMTIITDDMQQQKQLPSLCSELSYIGIMLIGVFDESYVEYLTTLQRPLLSIDHYYYRLPLPSVVTDNLEGAYYLTRKVIEYGHTELGFIGSIDMTSSIFERWCGFQRALDESGLPNREEFNIRAPSPLSTLLNDPEELYAYLKEFPAFPTAFVCAGDRIAISCIQALQMLGKRVPEDVSVVGFDDIELGKFISPRLTTMHVHRKRMGEAAVRQLLKLSHVKTVYDKVAFGATFVERDSLRRLP